jgi:ribosomal protein S28E/S33
MKGEPVMYEFRNVRGHVEVYDMRGVFLFSADTEREAREELEED